MNPIPSTMRRLGRSEDGAAAAEYAIVVAFVAAAVAAAASEFDLRETFELMSNHVLNLVRSVTG